jgi:hypothetical protein
MGRYRYIQLLLNVVYGLLVFCVADFRPLVVGGCVKLIASLVFACLLAFVIVHAPNICKLVAAYLQALPIALFPLLVDRRRVAHSQTDTAVPNEPNLSPLFQRPPPVFLL